MQLTISVIGPGILSSAKGNLEVYFVWLESKKFEEQEIVACNWSPP